MQLESRLHAPNSLLLVISSSNPEIPTAMDPTSITAHTKTCIAVGTVAEDDDEVAVSLTDERLADVQLSIAIEADLDTSAGFVAVETVLGDRLLEMPTASPQSSVRVWASNLVEPDRLIIEVLSSQ